MKNAPARFYELNADVTKNMSNYFFKYIADFIMFSTDTDSQIKRLCDVCVTLDNFGLKIYEKECTKNSVK